MGLLHKLWDETVAGPAPESGLGRLRERRSSSSAPAVQAAVVPRGVGFVSRRITIVRTRKQGGMVGLDSVPEPTARSSSDPGTPPAPAGTQQENFNELTRGRSSQALQKAEPRSPTVFDWILISALDR